MSWLTSGQRFRVLWPYGAWEIPPALLFVLRADLARLSNSSVLVRRCACPALLGQVSTARTCGLQSQEGSRSDRHGTARMGETWERRRRDWEVWYMCNKTPCRHDLSHACVCDTHEKCAKYEVSALCAETCACNKWVFVHPVVATPWCTKPLQTLCRNFCLEKINIHHSMIILTKKKTSIRRLGSEPFKILRPHHSMSVLIFLAGTCAISWLFINHCEWRRLGFQRRASLSNCVRSM